MRHASPCTRRLYPLIAAAAAAPAAAGPLVISPITVQLAPERHSAVVTVENAGDAPVDLQFRAYAWHQRDGADELVDTADVVVSPAIATIPPRGRQSFRVLERVSAGAGERSYRLRLTELPGPTSEAVAVRFNFLLPMFRGGAAQASAPNWTVAGDRLLVRNDGDRRLRLTSLSLRTADGAVLPLPVDQPTYLLAGSQRAWPLPGTAALAGARLVGATDTETFNVAPVVLAPPR